MQHLLVFKTYHLLLFNIVYLFVYLQKRREKNVHLSLSLPWTEALYAKSHPVQSFSING